jgi:hypothetical protein
MPASTFLQIVSISSFQLRAFARILSRPVDVYTLSRTGELLNLDEFREKCLLNYNFHYRVKVSLLELNFAPILTKKSLKVSAIKVACEQALKVN